MAANKQRRPWRILIKIIGAFVLGACGALLGALGGYILGNNPYVMTAIGAPCFALGAWWGWRKPGEVVAQGVLEVLARWD